MPFYEYECRRCKARFEAMVPMSARDSSAGKLECPECGGKGARRLVSTFATLSSSASSGAGFPCGADNPCAGST